jgi:hypothetical protein
MSGGEKIKRGSTVTVDAVKIQGQDVFHFQLFYFAFVSLFCSQFKNKLLLCPSDNEISTSHFLVSYYSRSKAL